MATNKTTVSLRLDKKIVESMDALVAKRRPFIQDRTHLIEMAVVEFIQRQIAQQAREAAASSAEGASAAAKRAAGKAAKAARVA
jgi:predicted transcriptional regulator